jgi:hypothetical protein
MNARGHRFDQGRKDWPISAHLNTPFSITLCRNNLGKQIDIAYTDIFEADDREVPPHSIWIVLMKVSQGSLRKLHLASPRCFLEHAPRNPTIARQWILNAHRGSGKLMRKLIACAIEHGIIGKQHVTPPEKEADKIV